jgi:predicted RecA/RadA family phage recombinase
MVHDVGTQLEVVRASTTSGQAMAIGQLPGVALTSSEAVTNKVTMKTDGVFTIPVLGPVAIGDLVYVVVASGVVNTVNTNVRFGYALEAIAGATTNPIKVKVGY